MVVYDFRFRGRRGPRPPPVHPGPRPQPPREEVPVTFPKPGPGAAHALRPLGAQWAAKVGAQDSPTPPTAPPRRPPAKPQVAQAHAMRAEAQAEAARANRAVHARRTTQCPYEPEPHSGNTNHPQPSGPRPARTGIPAGQARSPSASCPEALCRGSHTNHSQPRGASHAY